MFSALNRILHIRYPFNKQIRKNALVLLVLLQTAWFVFLFYYSSNGHHEERVLRFILIQMIINAVIYIASWIYVIVKWHGISIARETTLRMILRNTVAEAVWFICNIYFFVGFVRYLDPNNRTGTDALPVIKYMENPPVYILCLKVLFVVQGFILPFVRFSDPS